MTYSKNYSQAQAIKEQSDLKLRAMQRIMAGEEFTIAKDRFPRKYRFIYRNDLFNLVMVGGAVLSRCDTGAFFPSGFAVRVNILGDSNCYTVLTEDIRFVSDANQKGGAVC